MVVTIAMAVVVAMVVDVPMIAEIAVMIVVIATMATHHETSIVMLEDAMIGTVVEEMTGAEVVAMVAATVTIVEIAMVVVHREMHLQLPLMVIQLHAESLGSHTEVETIATETPVVTER